MNMVSDSDSETDKKAETPEKTPPSLREGPMNVSKDLNQKQLDKLIEDKIMSAKNSDIRKN